MKKLITIIGARPQFIKAAAISRVIREQYPDKISEVLIHTGQHYDPNMSDVFFEELNLPREDYNLHIGSGNHGLQTGQMMIAIEEVVLKEKPDALLLYGDTNSTLAGCLVGSKLHIPVIHVEAGVRSYNKKFPEEVNRIICDHVSSLLFVPSDAGMESLEKEGFQMDDSGTVRSYRCGDIMYDNSLYFRSKAKGMKNNVFDTYNLPKSNFILVTMHRPSNVDRLETLESILKAFIDVAEAHDKEVIFPMHPRTKHSISKFPELDAYLQNDRLHVIPSVSFLDIILLQMGADLVITDSGGVQKEAYFVEKPCLIMLEETPWVELLDTGAAVLVGSDYEKICSGAKKFLTEDTELVFEKLYGDGKSSEFICDKVYNYLLEI